MTDKKALIETRFSQDQLRRIERLVSLGSIISGVVHELNNPNTLVMLNAPNLKDMLQAAIGELEQNGIDGINGCGVGEFKAEAKVLADDLVAGSEKIKNIVKGLKNYACDEKAVESEEFSVNDCVTSAVNLAWNKLKNKSDKFSMDLDADLPNISGHSGSLEQVVLALLINACDAMCDRRKSITVSSAYDKAGKRAIIRVKDQGCGMDGKALKMAGNLLYTTKSDSGAIGLGLYVAKDIVKSMGGVIEIESVPGEGTTVAVKLPVE